jgi:hypothetical protein
MSTDLVTLADCPSAIQKHNQKVMALQRADRIEKALEQLLARGFKKVQARLYVEDTINSRGKQFVGRNARTALVDAVAKRINAELDTLGDCPSATQKHNQKVMALQRADRIAKALKRLLARGFEKVQARSYVEDTINSRGKQFVGRNARTALVDAVAKRINAKSPLATSNCSPNASASVGSGLRSSSTAATQATISTATRRSCRQRASTSLPAESFW